MKHNIEKNIDELIYILQAQNTEIVKFCELISNKIQSTLLKKKKIIICGNGGSLADSDHFVTEFNVKFIKKNRAPLNAVSLSNSSIISAVANDFSFENIFARQIEAIGSAGDLLLVFSTSGNSKNINKAIITANQMKIFTLGFFGNKKNNFTKKCNLNFHVKSESTARIQEVHKFIIHNVFTLLEKVY